MPCFWSWLTTNVRFEQPHDRPPHDHGLCALPSVASLSIRRKLTSAVNQVWRWFHDPERNPRNAQLWMSCHNVTLLDELIKEEVYFCEKDSRGRTRLYGLQDIQAVRRNDNYYQKYLGGRVRCRAAARLRRRHATIPPHRRIFLGCTADQILRKMRLRQRSKLGMKQTATKARAKASEVLFVLPLKAKRWW
jgi:hypothetical protein